MKLSWLKRILTYRFTFLLVPHGAGAPRQVSVHLSFLLFLTAVWTGITFWGSYLSAQHVDYWRTQASNEVLKMKVKYLMAQVDQTRGYLDEVRTVDSQLRELLKYQSNSTKTAAKPVKNAALKAEGGPTGADMGDLSRDLSTADLDVSWPRLVQHVTLMKLEAKDRISSYEDLTQWIETERRVLQATPRGWPCSGRLTSHFGRRLDPFKHLYEEQHLGIDIAAASGTPIRATADGVVRVAAWKSGYGNVVVLQHDYGYESRYAHNSRILVRSGDRVKRGQVLALMGATGRASGPHCHYEVWRYNQRKNPTRYLQEDPSGRGGLLTRNLNVEPVKLAKKGI